MQYHLGTVVLHHQRAAGRWGLGSGSIAAPAGLWRKCAVTSGLANRWRGHPATVFSRPLVPSP